jgi:hypothetical protein
MAEKELVFSPRNEKKMYLHMYPRKKQIAVTNSHVHTLISIYQIETPSDLLYFISDAVAYRAEGQRGQFAMGDT